MRARVLSNHHGCSPTAQRWPVRTESCLDHEKFHSSTQRHEHGSNLHCIPPQGTSAQPPQDSHVTATATAAPSPCLTTPTAYSAPMHSCIVILIIGWGYMEFMSSHVPPQVHREQPVGTGMHMILVGALGGREGLSLGLSLMLGSRRAFSTSLVKSKRIFSQPLEITPQRVQGVCACGPLPCFASSLSTSTLLVSGGACLRPHIYFVKHVQGCLYIQV